MLKVHDSAAVAVCHVVQLLVGHHHAHLERVAPRGPEERVVELHVDAGKRLRQVGRPARRERRPDDLGLGALVEPVGVLIEVLDGDRVQPGGRDAPVPAGGDVVDLVVVVLREFVGVVLLEQVEQRSAPHVAFWLLT